MAMPLLNRGRPLLFSFSSFVGARDQKPKTHDYHEEGEDSYNAPSENTGIILIAGVIHKLPKPGHLSFGHMFYKHYLCSVARSIAGDYSISDCVLDSLQDISE